MSVFYKFIYLISTNLGFFIKILVYSHEEYAIVITLANNLVLLKKRRTSEAKTFPKFAERYEQLLANLLYFFFNLSRDLVSLTLKSCKPWFEPNLCPLIGTFKRYWLMQNEFFTIKVLSWNLGSVTYVFHFTELEKLFFFFLNARPNSTITLIKTKCVVIYHGKKKKKMVVTKVIVCKGNVQ